MKKLLFFALIATIAITGCKKDEESKPSYNADVTISGVKTDFTGMIMMTTTGITDVWITNSDNESANKSLSIDIANPVVGDIDFSIDNEISIEIGDKTYSSKSGAGKITVTAKDASSIKGTFSGTFYNGNTEIQITGNFSAQKFSLTM